MYFLNLTFLQFAAVFGSIAAVSVALYLLDRSRRRQVVSTLRFWVASEQPAVAARRRRIQQPWSLILQLVSMALLVLAIGQLRLGTPARAGRDHVIVLETSSWMAARSGGRTLMDAARQRARQYLRALPARDRVMLVRADGLATPATAFEPDHRKVESAIMASQPGSTALNLDQALAFARHVQAEDGHTPGEIAFIGSGRTAAQETALPAPAPRNLRVLAIPDAVENTGLRKIGMRRAAGDPSLWEIYVSVHNYGTVPRAVNLKLDFGPPQASTRVLAGSERLTVQPQADSEASFQYRTAAAGILGVTLTPHDAFPADDHAELELPAQPVLQVIVYSDEPDLLRPVLSATPRVAAAYRRPSDYRPNDKGLVILDRFVPPERPAADSIWIDPPSQGSPIPVRTTVENADFAGWDSGNPVAAGLRTRDFKLARATVFEAAPSDLKIGSVEAGPVVVARPGTPKIVAIGFHPALSAMRYELSMPLLFADLLRWISPEMFRRWEVTGGSVGSVRLELDRDTDAREVNVKQDGGAALPFTLRDHTLDFYAGAPGPVKVTTSDREYLYSLTLPEVGDSRWHPPADARSGIPHFALVLDSSTDIWPWLAVLGAAGLAAEWLLYGRFRRMQRGRPLVIRRKAAETAEARR